ncbi:MAG TPA: heme biosynthesis HemY N-terminal domain-containing protein [Marinagarivorans sp.]
MRKFLLWVFLPFVFIGTAAMYLIPLMQSDPGYVLIAVGGKIIEMRFWMAALLLVLFVVAIWWTIALLKGTWRATIKTFTWWPSKSQALLWKRQERAMAALWEGNIHDAHRNFVKIAKTRGQEKDTLSLINAANTAADLSHFKEADHFLSQAERLSDKQHAITLIMSRARYHQRQGQNDAAMRLINTSLSQHPLHHGLLTLLLNLHRDQYDWSALHALLPRFKKASILSDLEQQQLECDVYRGLISAATTPEALDNVWGSIPTANKKEPNVEYRYLQQLLNLGCDTTAEPILRKRLKKHYDDELINLFAHTNTGDAEVQLQYAERWLDQKPNNPALMLALGRIALRAEQWDKARKYFEKSLKLKPSTEAYAELARLLGNLGDHQRSNALFQQGLLHTASDALPKKAAE